MRVLLTGATGFVGRHLYPALEGAGWEITCGTRDPATARKGQTQRRWVHLDVEDRDSVRHALADCDAAVYLVHGMGQSSDYPAREAQSARNFVAAAELCGVRRIVYLGGVLPPADHRLSKHLGSRKRTGELLRAGNLSTIEIRAAMIIGAGSASWIMVKDLAARLPAMVLPRWLCNHSYPVAIDDVIWALLAGLSYPGTESRVFEIPGPERMSHRHVLQRVAVLLGHAPPMIDVPVLTPRLSSYWIALVTRVDLALAKELVEGVRYDLEPRDDILWHRVSHAPMQLEAAARLALKAESTPIVPSPATTRRMRTLGSEFAEANPWSWNQSPGRSS
jgi:uncharacterized protein YbjT (DUF2867 family)